jgi:hypothetical protein
MNIIEKQPDETGKKEKKKQVVNDIVNNFNGRKLFGFMCSSVNLCVCVCVCVVFSRKSLFIEVCFTRNYLATSP